MSEKKTFIIPFDLQDPRLSDYMKELEKFMVSPEMLIDDTLKLFLTGGPRTYSPLMEYICDFVSEVYGSDEQYDVDMIQDIEAQKAVDRGLALAQESSWLLSEIINPVYTHIVQECPCEDITQWEVKRVGGNTFAVVVGEDESGWDDSNPTDRANAERCRALAERWLI